MTKSTQHSPAKLQKKDDGLAIASMVLGSVSLLGFGFILGIPAIIMAIISLKNKTDNKNLSIAGLITGAIGTILSFLFIVLVFLIALFDNSQPATPRLYYPHDNPNTQVFQSSRT